VATPLALGTYGRPPGVTSAVERRLWERLVKERLQRIAALEALKEAKARIRALEEKEKFWSDIGI
jgi:hypothetical protein